MKNPIEKLIEKYSKRFQEAYAADDKWDEFFLVQQILLDLRSLKEQLETEPQTKQSFFKKL